MQPSDTNPRRRIAVLLALVAALALPVGRPAAQTLLPRIYLPLMLRAAHPEAAGTAIPTGRARTSTPTATPMPTWTPAPSPTSSPRTTDVPPRTTPTPTSSPPPTVPPAPAACGDLPTFEDGLRPLVEIHVAVNGDDATGDGSAARPFRSLRPAALAARPGTAIRLHAGSYPANGYIDGLQGRPDAPIWLGGMPGEALPVIQGGGEALHFSRPRWLVVHDLEVRGASGNGINADDGGERAAVGDGHHLIFRGLVISDIGSGGNQDCLKLSGLGDVVVRDSHLARCGGGGSGSGIDMVGVHRALLARNHFNEMAANAIQAKGGSADVEIRWNRFVDGGQRVVNMGGSTGFDYFRPPLDAGAENAEARRIRLVANLIQGGDTPWAFVGCVDCLSAQNTVLEPRIWLMRILQETSSTPPYRFAAAQGGRVINNLFVFRRGQLRADVNVGGGTAPETFRFLNNLWYALDDPARSRPSLPVAEQGAVIGRDPRLAADGSIAVGSPADGAGLPMPGGWAPGDLAGRCWSDPPSLGAFEAR